MSAHEAHPAWSFHFMPFFFLGLGGPPGTWGGAATRAYMEAQEEMQEQ